jgi:hypothetical protein
VYTLRKLVLLCTLGAAALIAAPAHASYHLWQIDQIYSNASGTVQYIQFTTGDGGQQFLSGHSIVVMQNVVYEGYGYPMPATHSYNIAGNLPGDTTNKRFLVATQGFADLNIVKPDYVVANGFLFLTDSTLSYAGADMMSYGALPTDGMRALTRTGAQATNSFTNFAGKSGSIGAAPAPTVTVSLENPQPSSFQSGIGLLSGWACQGPSITILIDGSAQLAAPYGSSRADTASVCGAGNTNTGFGLLFNFNNLGAGTHQAQLSVNGQAQGSPIQFTVTVPSGEFLTGASKEVTVSDFPTAGRTTTLIWQQSQQNYAVKSVTP